MNSSKIPFWYAAGANIVTSFFCKFEKHSKATEGNFGVSQIIQQMFSNWLVCFLSMQYLN